MFGVKVKTVNTRVTKGKATRFRGRAGERSDKKKAYVMLEDGQTIDVSTGLRASAFVKREPLPEGGGLFFFLFSFHLREKPAG
jgi:hypothetical protein